MQTGKSSFQAIARLGHTGVFALDGRLHVEKHMFDVARLVQMLESLGEAFDIVF
ncbi:MAG: hypothetical protein ACLPWF_07515 [Bryobacteraceae bacterium]